MPWGIEMPYIMDGIYITCLVNRHIWLTYKPYMSTAKTPGTLVNWAFEPAHTGNVSISKLISDKYVGASPFFPFLFP